MGLLDWLNPLSAITGSLERAYQAKLAAANDTDRIAAEVEIENLKARRDVVISASLNDKWWSPRTIMGWSAALYVGKIVVWDTVLQWGVTPNPGEQVTMIVMTIVGFYFVAKGAETVANTLASVIRRK
jgi:hypothetical protein